MVASTQQYGTVPSRNLIRAEMTMLKHAEPIQVLGKFGDQKEQPLNKTDTIVFRRLKPFNANANETPNITAANFVTSEGSTPTANGISYTDVSVTIQQFAVLFKFSSKAQLMYEDNIPADMQKLTGETLAEVAELVAYGQTKGGLGVIYSNGSTRLGLNTTLLLKKLRQAARTMEINRAKRVTSAIGAGPDFNTAPVEPAYLVFLHTDLEADSRDLDGFTRRVEYGSAIKPVHEREFGAVEQFRFISSPLFAPYLTAGSATANGCVQTGGQCDVYPVIVMAQSALGHVSLKGNGYTGISPTLISAKQKNHANPSGMFGYVGADFWYACVLLNQNWMTRIECCASDLS